MTENEYLNTKNNGKLIMDCFRVFAFFGLIFISNTIFSADFDSLIKEAEKGDANTQYSLGLAYAIDTDIEENSAKSTKWIKLAAQNGSLGAQLHYGQNLPDHIEGLKWIKKSAVGDYIPAQTFLGELYRTERNQYVKEDIKQSIFWLTKAAERSDFLSINASFRLFLIFESGDGVTEDSELASYWLKKTLENNIFDAKKLYEYGITSDTFDDGFRYIRLAAELGYPEAQNQLGKIYTYDFKAFNSPEVGRIYVERDRDKSIKWLELAAKNGNVDAYYQLGILYQYGIFKKNAKEGDLWLLKPNTYEAVKYYRWAAQSNHTEAQDKMEQRNTYESDSWDEHDRAISRYMNNYLEYTWFEGTVSFSRGGDKKLYILIKESKNICQPDDYKEKGTGTVWEISNQAVSMIIFCEKNNNDFYQLTATPKTVQGTNFVINTFLKSSSDILIDGSGYSFPLSATDFSNVWNNKSDKAL